MIQCWKKQDCLVPRKVAHPQYLLSFFLWFQEPNQSCRLNAMDASSTFLPRLTYLFSSVSLPHFLSENLTWSHRTQETACWFQVVCSKQYERIDKVLGFHVPDQTRCLSGVWLQRAKHMALCTDTVPFMSIRNLALCQSRLDESSPFQPCVPGAWLHTLLAPRHSSAGRESDYIAV